MSGQKKKYFTIICVVQIGGNGRFKIQQYDDMPCGRPHYTVKDLNADKVIYEIRREDLCTVAISCNDVIYRLFGNILETF